MTRIGKIAFYGTLSTIFLSAIPYGSSTPLPKSVLCVLVCIFGAMRALAQINAERSFSIRHPHVFLPLAGILVVAALQILPLPLVGSTISQDPYETKVFIISFATVVVAGEVLAYFHRTKRSLRALIFVVLITAAASALFGLSRDLFLDDHVTVLNRYFTPDSQGYAQFVNRNHFVLLIEMALGLTFGLLLKGRPSNLLKFGLLVLAGLFVYSAVAANSRGGVVSCAALTASAVFFHFLTKRRPERRQHGGRAQQRAGAKLAIATAFCLLTIGVSIFTIAFVGGDEMIVRIERIEDEVKGNRMNRLAIWRSTMKLIEDHPVIGIGFGAYAYAIPKYVATSGGWRMEQAHNDYLEILANGGLIAFALFFISGFFVLRRSFTVFASNDRLIRSSCFGALAGMLGVFIHSFVDFGLHIMVNALILMVLIVIATTPLQAPSFSTRPEANTS